MPLTPPTEGADLPIADGWENVDSCDLCGAALPLVDRVAGVPEEPVVRCPSCGLVATNPRPTPERIGTHYPAGYYAHTPPPARGNASIVSVLKAYRGGYPSPHRGIRRLAWQALARVFGRLFITNLPFRGKGRRLLDVGCGVGDALALASDLGWEVHGVEPDAEAVRVANARGLTGVRAGTLDQQHYPDDFFDAITLYQALEHVHSPRRLLEECSRILRPGGEIFISVPNFASWPRMLLGSTWNGFQLPLHLYHFDAETLPALVDDCGFDVVEIRYNALPVAVATNLRHHLRQGRHQAGSPSPLSWPGRLRSGLTEVPSLKVCDILLVVARASTGGNRPERLATA